eukprot:6473181-Amphidinium_carterae.1
MYLPCVPVDRLRTLATQRASKQMMRHVTRDRGGGLVPLPSIVWSLGIPASPGSQLPPRGGGIEP